jgi:ABC-2 type transport system ATP-binding protein
MYAIETHNLTKKYGNLTAVDSLTLSVERGRIFGLLGPNGAGKSTLLSMLCTVLYPTSGSAMVNGYDIIKDSQKVRQSIGIVFQSISVDDRLTGRENLKFHAMLYDVAETEILQRITEVLKLLELEDRADDLVRTYSGGMIRRLEMARGLLHHPEILFLDEPTIGLDPQTREHIWKYIRDLTRKKQGSLTILLTTHYMDEADLLCDDIAIIDNGRITIRDTPERLKEHLKKETIVIRTSYPQLLANALADSDYILGATISPDSITLNVKDGGKNAPEIINAARDAGIPVEHISISEPTLNDVFLHHTGKEIRREEDDNFTSQYKRQRRRR